MRSKQGKKVKLSSPLVFLLLWKWFTLHSKRPLSPLALAVDGGRSWR